MTKWRLFQGGRTGLIHHSERLKKKKKYIYIDIYVHIYHMILSINVEKAFKQTQHPFMIQILRKK